MPRFSYAAIDAASGREVKGEVEAPDPRAVAQDLRTRRLMPLEIKEGAGAARPQEFSPLAYLSYTRTTDVIFFLQQLALMLRAGLTLLQALTVSREQARKPGMARAIDRMKAGIEAGRAFSEVLAAESAIPPIGAKLVSAAEQTGDLDVTLDRVADYLQRRLELRQGFITALIYPTIVVLATSGVFVFLVTNVFPKLARFVQRRGRGLPPLTRFLLDLNAFFGAHGLKVVAAAAAAVLALVVLRRTDSGRRAIDRALLRVPLVGGVLTTGAMAQLGATLAMLLRGGVPLLEALRATSGTLLSTAFAGEVDRAAEVVLRGGDLTSGLASPYIPPLVRQVVATGERTGALDAVLDEVGRFYEADLKRKVARMTAIFGPLVIACVAGVVGFVYIAFFQGLYSAAVGGG